MLRKQGFGGGVLELDPGLKRRIDELARESDMSPSDLVRAAIEQYAPPSDRRVSWMESAEAYGLIGCSAGR